MNECFKPHLVVHLLSGLGIGLLLVGLLPDLAANALTFGVVLIVVGLIGEFLYNKKAQSAA